MRTRKSSTRILKMTINIPFHTCVVQHPIKIWKQRDPRSCSPKFNFETQETQYTDTVSTKDCLFTKLSRPDFRVCFIPSRVPLRLYHTNLLSLNSFSTVLLYLLRMVLMSVVNYHPVCWILHNIRKFITCSA